MLAVSPLISTGHDDNGGEMLGDFSALAGGADNFSDDCSPGNLLEDIDFDDLFVEFDEGDVLPDLEVDPTEILAEFSVGGREESGSTTSAEMKSGEQDNTEDAEKVMKDDKGSIHADEVAERKNRTESSTLSSSAADRGRKSSASQSKNSHSKRKVKVDWTPELHRRFVQAVEQLGVDKAVPSRILEVMGIDCRLTRHNIASHLQKYRSHRKHLLAREAEAASWSHRRQVYPVAGGGVKREMNPWIAPTIGFPPPIQPFRPLHVWGHPTVDHSSLVHMWPKHLVSSRTHPPPPPPWTPQPPPPPPEPSYWHHHHYQRGSGQGWIPSALTQGTPCIPQPLQPARFPVAPPPVTGIPPHPLYKPETAIPIPASKQPGLQIPLVDSHPSKESIDSAIEDVLTKRWLPLPIGLKPPSLDSVLVELQRQGVSKIPPSSA